MYETFFGPRADKDGARLDDGEYMEPPPDDDEAFAAWLNPPTPASDTVHAKAQHSARNRAETALKRAEKAARRGDAAEAKRWSDIAVNLADAARTLAEAPAPIDDPQGDERLRTELLERIRAVADDDLERQRWEIRHEIWKEMAEQARAEGRPLPSPLPPRPAHWSDDLPEDLRERLT